MPEPARPQGRGQARKRHPPKNFKLGGSPISATPRTGVEDASQENTFGYDPVPQKQVTHGECALLKKDIYFWRCFISFRTVEDGRVGLSFCGPRILHKNTLRFSTLFN